MQRTGSSGSWVWLAETVFLDPAGHQSVAVVLVGGKQGAVYGTHTATVCCFALALFPASQTGLDFSLNVEFRDYFDYLFLLWAVASYADGDTEIALVVVLWGFATRRHVSS
jgi:hypothetical protein